VSTPWLSLCGLHLADQGVGEVQAESARAHVAEARARKLGRAERAVARPEPALSGRMASRTFLGLTLKSNRFVGPQKGIVEIEPRVYAYPRARGS
jgi:hypothetical protein